MANVADRHFRPGWVRTIHSAQGATCERVMAHLESFRSNVDANIAYVAVSRAKASAIIYTDDRDRLALVPGGNLRQARRHALAHLGRRLSRAPRARGSRVVQPCCPPHRIEPGNVGRWQSLLAAEIDLDQAGILVQRKLPASRDDLPGLSRTGQRRDIHRGQRHGNQGLA